MDPGPGPGIDGKSTAAGMYQITRPFIATPCKTTPSNVAVPASYVAPRPGNNVVLQHGFLVVYR